MASSIKLTGMPDEITHEILKALDPLDLAALSQTCRSLHQVISGNELLFKSIYLNHMDEPVDPFIPAGWQWMEQLKKFVQFRRALEDLGDSLTPSDSKVSQLGAVSSFTSELMSTAKSGTESLNIGMLSKYFASRRNQEAFLCRSSLFRRAVKTSQESGLELDPPSTPIHVHPPTSPSEAQLSAKLHCLHGVYIASPSRTHYKDVYPYAVSVVYDLRNYTDGNFWGPYHDDGQATVDWEKMEAVMIILGHNLRMFVERTRNSFRHVWRDPWFGASPDSFRPISVTCLEQPAPPMEALDPYNISGTWMRVVCFLDFHDLFAYNFAVTDLADDEPRPPLNTTEAIRLIVMEIKVTKIRPSENDSGYPIVSFTGVSRSMHTSFDPNANSSIRGTVRMTPEGEVRWTTFSIYSGDHDIHGPAGPTAFWKVSNEISEHKFDRGHGDWDDDSDEDDGDYLEDDEEDEVVVLEETEEVMED
ncbi:hypothetical protein LSUE1_G009103 [Lachnellula suecica]|uniref:F-box domain-containing protein n=1 Tax=Lachnellula suecica TaxID=602035 RepID=A0A8T9C707_9HELO|nr:hypothetical protein LSUE1_G009103 [Lachnellula suecica]